MRPKPGIATLLEFGAEQLQATRGTASVNSLYFMILYLFFAVPTIALGLAATYLGLSRALGIFSTVVAALAIIEIAWLAIRQRGPR